MSIGNSYFFDTSEFHHASLFEIDSSPWRVLHHLIKYLKDQKLGANKGTVSPHAYLINSEQITIGEGSVVEPGAYIRGPCLIGKHCVIRHGAYIRGNVFNRRSLRYWALL